MTGADLNPAHLNPEYRRALILCALLNLAMLFVEGAVGWWIGSAALLGDAADFLEDAAVLGLALVAIRWLPSARAKAAVAQGLAMAGVGIIAAMQVVRRLLEGGAPSPHPMGAVAVLALIVNIYCAYRLVRFRRGDSSMRAIWLSTRNDAILNVMTVAAAGLIALTGSGWPDIVAGAVIASINLYASFGVMRTAIGEIGKHRFD